jgi:hypothetical protein
MMRCFNQQSAVPRLSVSRGGKKPERAPLLAAKIR